MSSLEGEVSVGLAAFLEQLLTRGEVVLTSSRAALPEQAADAQPAILALDRRARRDYPGEAPALSLPAATWAARLLHRACQYFAFRELGPDEVRIGLSEPCPAPVGLPSTVYSADLTLRHLPDLCVLARGVADEDPLLDGLRELASEWPLSSVGIPGVGADDLDAEALAVVLDVPGLRQLYVDRVIAAEDLPRLAHSAVADRVRAALGLHTHLAPRIAQALEATA